MAERKKKKSLWDDPSYGRSVRSYLEEIISENEAIKRARIGAEEYQSPSELAVARELEGPAYSPGEEAWARYQLPLDRKRLADKQAELAASEAKKAATAAEFSEKAAELKALQDRLRREAGSNMGIIDTVPPDPEQFRAGEGTSPTTALSEEEKIALWRPSWFADRYALRRDPDTGEWRGTDPMGFSREKAGFSERAPDEYILSDEVSAKAEDEMMFARDARKEAAAALAAPDKVALVNTIGVGPIDDRGDIPVGAEPIGSTTPDASLNSPAVKEASAGKGDFLSRMARFNEIAPQFLGISPEVLQNRKHLQRRNDVLRAFQRMGPKDIVWSDNMTTAQMVAQYKREQDTFLGRAMAATNPQVKDDVNLLARKLGVGLEGWTKMLDVFEKGRLDYGYLEQEWNVRGKIETDKAEHYADILLRGILMGTGRDGVEYIRSPVEQEEMLDVVLAKTKNIKVRDLVKAGFTSRRAAVDAQEVVRYDLPWGWVDTENNRATLKQLGLSFTEMDPTKKTNALSANPWGRTNERWLFVNMNDAAAYNLDLRDKKNRVLEATLYARPDQHTGFGQSDAAVDAPIMNLVGPNGRVYPGMGYAQNNATGRSYADYLSRYYGFSSVMENQLEALNKNWVGWKTKKDYISATAIKADADRVASISSKVLAIDDLERGRRDENGKLIGRSIFGGVTGLQLTIMNYQQLADDLISFAGGEPSGPGVAQYDPGTDEAQAGVLFNEFMLTNTVKDINDILDDLDDPTKLIDTDDARLKKAKDDLRIDMHLMRARLEKMLDETPQNFQQNALYAEMLSISLATMAARMLTRKDRLLKDQYTMWRERLNIHKWNKSADRARAQMQALKRFAKFSSAYYVKTIQDLTPPAHKYQRTREGHLEAASTSLAPATVDELVREHG